MQVSKSITDKIDAITKIPESHLGLSIPAPKSVKISITENCNYKCKFCTRSLMEGVGEMDRKLYSRIIRELKDAGVEELGVFWLGESMVCKWLPEAIREAKEIGFEYVFLTTNGSASTPQKVRECMEAGLDSLKFSINFYDSQQLKEVAQVPERFFRKAIDHLKEARKVRDEGGYDCGIFASSIDLDGEQGEKMRAVVEEIAPYCDEYPYRLPLYGMAGSSEKNGYVPTAGNPGRVGALQDPLPCHSLFSEAFISKDGILCGCCFGTGFDDGSIVFGDLRKTPFMEAWNSEAAQTLRAAHLRKDVTGTGCEQCIAAGGKP